MLGGEVVIDTDYTQLLFSYLPTKIKEDIQDIFVGKRPSYETLEEIRIRAGQRTQYVSGEASRFGVECDCEDIEEMINYLSDYSYQAIREQLKRGYFSVPGGHRVGIAGHIGYEEGQVKSVFDIGALNIRIAHEIKDCGKELLPYIRDDRSIHNTLIISPPGLGKTTLLRDIVRGLSSGSDGGRAFRIGVVDERSEIGGCYRGRPTRDLGPRTDILDACPKSVGMKMMLRSMSPEIIAVDELGGKEDENALAKMLLCGIKLMGTMHAGSFSEVKEWMWAYIKRLVTIRIDEAGKRWFEIYDETGRQLNRVCGSGRPDSVVGL